MDALEHKYATYVFWFSSMISRISLHQVYDLSVVCLLEVVSEWVCVCEKLVHTMSKNMHERIQFQFKGEEKERKKKDQQNGFTSQHGICLVFISFVWSGFF